MSRAASEEHRKEARLRALKGGKVVFNQHASVIDCVVRDLSGHGARLQVTTSVGIPERFDLVFDADNTSRSCRLVWRSDQQVGVEFVSA